MPTPHWSTKLELFNPCAEALEYARSKPSFAAAWRDCKRGDWMLWILGRLSGPPDSVSRKALVAAAVDCAALARKHTSGKTRKAFDHCQRTVRKYLRRAAVLPSWGAETLAEVRTAANAAAYTARAEGDEAYAACACANAAAAAYAEANAATAAAYYTSLASSTADDQMSTLSRCASIVHRHHPNPPRLRKGA